MGWNFDYTVRPDSGSHQDLVALGYADNVRILPEVSGGMRARPKTITHAHGERVEGRTPVASFDFVLQVDVSYGPIPPTHGDGAPGHLYENRADINELMLGHTERVWVGRTAPHQGDVELPVIVQRAPRTGAPRNRLLFTCRALDPFWRDQAVSFSAVNPVSGVTVTGDAPIGDGSFSFSGTNGVQRLTHTTYSQWIELDADTTSTPIVVNCGTGSVTQSGSPVAGLTSSDPWLVELQPGSNAFTLSGGGAVSFTGRTKWR